MRNLWRSRKVRVLSLIVGVLAIGLVLLRLALPTLIERYVEDALAQSKLYEGRVGSIDLDLWRGAYTIEDIRILKRSAITAVPFFAAERVELAVEWSSLLSGAVVGKLVLFEPEMSFIDARDPAAKQAGSGPWLPIISRLFPFSIDSAEVRDGRIAFRAFDTDPPVDVYLSDVRGSVLNLTNLRDDLTPMFARVRATARAMDHARLEFAMDLDASSYHPSFKLQSKLKGLDVREINSLARAYAELDFEGGWLDLVVEMDARYGRVSGYLKPIFRDLQVVAIDDIETDLLGTFWEALVGVAGVALENQWRNQISTVIPLEGDIADPTADLAATVGHLLFSSFIRAYLPTYDGPVAVDLRYGPGTTFADPQRR